MNAKRLARTCAPPSVRVVHLGLGSFFRAHQAWYTAAAPDAAGWGIAAFTGRSTALADALTGQDCLYTLAVRGADGDTCEVVDSVVAAHAGTDLDAGEPRHVLGSRDGVVTATISGQELPWGDSATYGLAYRPDDDSFYIGSSGVIYHVKGLSHPDPGAVIGQCLWSPPGSFSFVAGLGWNRTHGVLWVATISDTDTIYQVDPETCEPLKAVAPPDQEPQTGAGLDVDPLGNLWVTSTGSPGTVYQLDAGLPEANDVPWLRVRPARGRLAPNRSAALTVTLDTAGLAPGTYGAYLVLASNSGREPAVVLPVRLQVRAATSDEREETWFR